MKKLIVVMLGICILLSSCGTSANDDKIARLEAELSNLKAQDVKDTSDNATTVISKPTSKRTIVFTSAATIATPTQAYSDIGSRKNPARIGDKMYISGKARGTDTELEVILNSVTSGEEANTIIMEENRFNKIPSGYEAIILNFTMKLTEYKPKDDSSYRISYLDGEFFRTESVVFPDELDGELYEGATITGNIAFVAPEGQAALYRY